MLTADIWLIWGKISDLAPERGCKAKKQATDKQTQ
jgi:hypothetical protein